MIADIEYTTKTMCLDDKINLRLKNLSRIMTRRIYLKFANSGIKEYTHFRKNQKTLDVEYSQKENTYSLKDTFPPILRKPLKQIFIAHKHFIFIKY